MMRGAKWQDAVEGRAGHMGKGNEQGPEKNGAGSEIIQMENRINQKSMQREGKQAREQTDKSRSIARARFFC